MANCKECGGTLNHISNNLVKCEFCGKLYSMINGELLEANKAQIYDLAVTKAQNQNEQVAQEAIELFEALGSYRDSTMRAIECKDFIRKQKVLEEDRRLEARRQAEKEEIENQRRAEQQAKVARIKGICIAGVALCVLVVVVVVSISYLSKKTKYEDAMELYTRGQYEDALEKFDSLGGYSDAQTYVENVSNLIIERENSYNQGVSYFNSGLYEKSIEELSKVSNYLDASEYIEKAADTLYQNANELFVNEEYTVVKEKLSVIPQECSVYTQAQTLLVQTEEILVEKEKAANYEAAIKSFEEGQYDTAQQLFMSLGDYSDVQNYLSTIGTSYYSEAQDLYNAGNYVECAGKLECIDTVEEWTEYTVASDLKQQAADAYYNMVEKEAKNVCRREGDAAMANYLDGAVCSILTTDEVAVLKESCHIEVISLSEMEPYVTGYHEITGYSNREDTIGNTYNYALWEKTISFGKERSNTYYLDRKYTVFSATVAVGGGKDNRKSGIIRIYGDGRLLWSDENIKAATKPYPIEVDVEGVEDLKIEMYGTDELSWTDSTGISIMLGNPMLSE